MFIYIFFLNTLLFPIALSQMDIDVTPFVPPSVCYTCAGESNNTECNDNNTTMCATGESCQNVVVENAAFNIHLVYKKCIGFYICSYGAGVGCQTNSTTNTTTCAYCCIGELCNAGERVALVVPNFMDIIYQTLINSHAKRQIIINIVLGLVAILSLTLALIGLAASGLVSKTVPFIHFNLCLAMLLSQFLVMMRSTGTGSQSGCRLMAFLIHYFYMVGASQFAMEGVHLLVTLGNGITRVWKKWQMLVIGWGLPLVISVIAIIVATDGYGPPSPLQKYCWLSFKIGTWWGMQIPIVLVQLFGIVCVIIIGVLHNRVKDGSDDEEYNTFKSNFVAFIAVLILYIATWLFAFMELNPFKTKMPYFFVTFHALLGIVISLLYCAFNYEVRLILKSKISPN